MSHEQQIMNKIKMRPLSGPRERRQTLGWALLTIVTCVALGWHWVDALVILVIFGPPILLIPSRSSRPAMRAAEDLGLVEAEATDQEAPALPEGEDQP